MRDAYEIFKNTYVNDKQQHLEQTFNRLAKINGATSEISIIPVEPISYELSEATIVSVAPREWILEKAGIDVTKYQTEPSAAPVDGTTPQAATSVTVNDNLKSMTGRQWQQMARIVREFSKGKITRDQAGMMLRSGYGLSDDEVMTMLGEPEQFGADATEDDIIGAFAEYGETMQNFSVVKNSRVTFADIQEEADKQILNILQKQPLTPSDDIAKALGVDVAEITRRIDRMTRLGVLIEAKGGGLKPSAPVSELVDEPTRTTFEIRYSYEWKPEVPVGQRDTAEHPSRPFCKKLMSLDRFYTRREIETLSQRLGYSVFDRGGGWWGQGAGLPPSPSCRHEWRSNVVIRKRKS